MRAERFGSYSISRTVAGTPNLLRRKSMMRYMPLVAAAATAHGDMPVIVAATRLLERLQQRLLGRRPRDLARNPETERKRELLVTGLNWRIGITEAPS